MLTERLGLKPQGKSAPMASSKRSTNVGAGDTRSRSFGSNSGHNPPQNGSRSPQHNSTFDFDYGSFTTTDKKSQNFGGGGIDEIFGGGNAKSNSGSGGSGVSFDYDPIFGVGSNNSVSRSSSPPSSHVYVDDIFGGIYEKSVGVDDLLGKIDGLHVNNAKSSTKKDSGFDDLMAAFGGSSASDNNRYGNLSLVPFDHYWSESLI